LASADNKELTNLKNFDDLAIQLTDELVKKIKTNNSALTFKRPTFLHMQTMNI
jgi:hypothetical protein